MYNIPGFDIPNQNEHISLKFGIKELMLKIFSYLYNQFPPGKITELSNRGSYFHGEESIQNFRNDVEINNWLNIKYDLDLFLGVDNHVIPFTQKISINVTQDTFRVRFDNNNKIYEVELKSSYLNVLKEYDTLIYQKEHIESDINFIDKEIESCTITEKISDLREKKSILIIRHRILMEEIQDLSVTKKQIDQWFELRQLLLNCELYNAVVDPPFYNKKIYNTFIHAMNFKYSGSSLSSFPIT